MLYNLSKVNANEWFVYSMTTLLASHSNGSTLPPVGGKMAKNQDLNGCHAITKRPYNFRGVPNALYCLQRSMQLSAGLYTAYLLKKSHTVMAP